jgi:hypothetical protein
MKKIWKYLRNHFKEDYSPGRYLAISVFLTALIIINYKLDFEDSVLDSKSGFVKLSWYFLFYSIPYYITVIITSTGSDQKIWTTDFIGKSLFGLTVLSIDASVPFLRPMLESVDPRIHLWSYKLSVNLVSVFTVLLPLSIYYRLAEKNKTGFYGLTPERFDYKPYFVMLLIMLPLLIAATKLPGFLKQYPMYKTSQAHEFLHVPEYVTALSYELAYGFDFVTVELLFRGFMVIGLGTLIGRKAVLAMAVVYCLLHFGKPAGEAISSIFGGYILGVIAYETRSIWGGVIVHVGIAWMMELISYIAKQIDGV